MRAMHTSRREGPFLSKRRLHSHLESEICAWHHLQRSRPVACESLRQACCKAITDAINVHSVLMILQFVRQVEHACTVAVDINRACVRFIQHTYSRVREVHTASELREVIGQDLWADLEAWERQIYISRRLLHVEGSVVMRSVSYKEGDETARGIYPSSRLSVAGAGHRSYPYEWLLAGKEWPDDVDPSERERFLEGPMFVRLFGMTYQAFSELPLWQQLQRKQAVLLF